MGSNSSSGSSLNIIPARRIISASSRVVMEISTSGRPTALCPSRPISNFLAVQGITLTTTMFLGSSPAFWA